MLQQILNDMYIDPDVLEALNEEQKRILFIKMREEQVRRWKEREEKDAKGEMKKEKLRQKKGPCKSVSWLLGSDGDVHVCIIGESDDIKSPKLILAELRNKTTDNLNNINRANTEPVNNSLTKVIREPQTSTDEGIQLLLKKPEELRHTGADTDEFKQDSGSDHSADDTKGQTDDSDSTEEEIVLYKPHISSTAATLADSLNEVRLHRAMKEQLSITDETRPLNKPYKGTVRMKDSSVSGNRVAQLRKTFNPTNDNGPAPCVKPPIPSKPLHLLTSPSVR